MDGCFTTKLNDHERQLADAVALGMPVAFPDPKPSISAGLIRHLLLGHTVPRAQGPAGVGWPGVRIKGARIEGPLDFADCARPGEGLPTLALEACDITHPIDLGAARLARLSLAGSKFSFLNLREAEIDGPFDFSNVAGLCGDTCWIDARGALFGGDLMGAGAKLAAPSPRPDPLGDDRRSALWLAGATIRGSVRLTAGFAAWGGVSIDSANVHGDAELEHASITAGESDAFRAQNASVGGVMLLHYFNAEGVLYLHGLRTGGMLQISHATIRGAHPRGHGTRHARYGEPMAIIAADAEIGASLRLSPNLVALGLVSVAVSKVRGQFDAVGARLTNRSEDGRFRALNATNAEIGASFLFDDATVEGRLDLAGTRIVGRLSFIGAWLENRTPDSAGKALDAPNMTVGANLDFGRDGDNPAQLSAEQPQRDTYILGAIDLTGATIGGDLAFTTAVIRNLQPSDSDERPRPPQNNVGIALVARQIRVQASILFDGEFASFGALLLTGATVGRDLLCHNATLHNPARSALYAKDIEIGDDLKLLETTTTGDLRFERAAVNGSVIWENLALRGQRHAAPEPPRPVGHTVQGPTAPPGLPRLWACIRQGGASTVGFVYRGWTLLTGFPAWLVSTVRKPHRHAHATEPDPPHIPRLDLSHARVGSRLRCARLRHEDPSKVDLTGLRVATLDLRAVDGWGRPEGAERHYPISLDLLVYDRLIFPEKPLNHVADADLRTAAGIPRSWVGPTPDGLADRLLDWVLRDPANIDLRLDHSDCIIARPVRFRDRRHFNPQPYRQLTRVLRAQGYEDAARTIAVAEQWATPRRGAGGLLHFLYGACFGFGLSRRRALVTLGIYVVLGTMLAITALRLHWMAETPLIATSAFTMEDGQAKRAFVPAALPAQGPAAPGGANTKPALQHDLACYDFTGALPDGVFDGLAYAVDTVLPFIPLHQETKCELRPEYHFLRFCRAVYAVMGWIITSLALLTVSGILKRFDGEAS